MNWRNTPLERWPTSVQYQLSIKMEQSLCFASVFFSTILASRMCFRKAEVDNVDGWWAWAKCGRVQEM